MGHFTLGCKVKALTGTLWAGERQGEVRLEDVAWEKEAETSGGGGGRGSRLHPGISAFIHLPGVPLAEPNCSLGRRVVSTPALVSWSSAGNGIETAKQPNG